MAKIDFFANTYLTDLKEVDSIIEAIESKAADAATDVLIAAGITFEQAMAADGARCNDEDFDAVAAAAYDAAETAARAAIADEIKGTGAFISLGWR